MSDATGHDAVRELLALAALDALSPEERRTLDAHLTTCDECRRELASLRDGVASIAESLPARAMPPEREAAMRARLMERAIEDRRNVTPIRASSTYPVRVPRPRHDGLRQRHSSSPPARSPTASASAEQCRQLASHVAALRDSTNSMQQQLAEQQSVLDALTGPGVRVIDASAASARQPYARMFWDQPTNRWTFVAYNLPAAAAGHTYQLWLVTRDQKKVSAGTFASAAQRLGHRPRDVRACARFARRHRGDERADRGLGPAHDDAIPGGGGRKDRLALTNAS